MVENYTAFEWESQKKALKIYLKSRWIAVIAIVLIGLALCYPFGLIPPADLFDLSAKPVFLGLSAGRLIFACVPLLGVILGVAVVVPVSLMLSGNVKRYMSDVGAAVKKRVTIGQKQVNVSFEGDTSGAKLPYAPYPASLIDNKVYQKNAFVVFETKTDFIFIPKIAGLSSKAGGAVGTVGQAFAAQANSGGVFFEMVLACVLPKTDFVTGTPDKLRELIINTPGLKYKRLK